MKFDLVLQIQSQLLAEEEVLSARGTPRPQAGPNKPQGIAQQIEHGPMQAGQEIEFRHIRQDLIRRTFSSSMLVNPGIMDF